MVHVHNITSIRILGVHLEKIIKGGGGGDKSGMLWTLGGGGGGGEGRGNVQRGVVCTPHTRGDLGACSPRKILKYRPSEI